MTEATRYFCDEHLKLLLESQVEKFVCFWCAQNKIAEREAEAATQGQAVSGALREALRDAAIEAHVGFNHPRQWADCPILRFAANERD